MTNPTTDILRFNLIAGVVNPDSRGLYVRYEDHVAALAAPVQAEDAPVLKGLAKRKLVDLTAKGYAVCGVMIRRADPSEAEKYGAVSDAGRVIWWQPDRTAPVQAVPVTGEVQRLCEALQFYADGNHFILNDEDAWDTISDEPQNFWEDEAGTAMVEDGSIAKAALAASPAAAAGPSDHLFELWWAEHMPEATQAKAWAAWTAAPRADGSGAVAAPDEREAFKEWFTARHGLPPDADIIQYDSAFEPWNAWQARAALSATPPEVQPTSYQVQAITTAYEQGVGKGHDAFNRKVEIDNPYSTGYRCDEAWQLGYNEGKLQAERKAKAEVQTEPVAWRIFDGEGGFDFRCFQGNENFTQEWERRNPNHKGWVEALYTAPQAQPADALDAVRYRHLRDCNSGSLVIVHITSLDDDGQHVLTEESADEAIDSAIAQANGGEA